MNKNYERWQRPYKMADVRRCFPLISDPVVGRWIEKGYISHGTAQRGTMQLYTFSLGEVVHIGVLSMMSTYGITRSHSPVCFGMVSGFGPNGDTQSAGTWSLTCPHEIVELYEQSLFDLCYIFYSTAVSLKDKDISSSNRNKQAMIDHWADIVNPRMVFPLIHQFLFEHAGPQYSNDMPTCLLIHVGIIANNVGKALKLGPLWASVR